MIARANVELKGSRSSGRYVALIDTGSAMTIVDRALADALGVEYTGRKRSLVTASGWRIEGEVAIVEKLILEGEPIEYEKILVVDLSENVKESLRKLGVSDSVIVGITTVEIAGFTINTSTGRLEKTDLLFLLC